MTLEQAVRGHLLERDGELARVAAALDAGASGEGRVLLVEGDPGIGKTALLAEARGAAADAGWTVLSAAGAALEHEFAWGVVRQVFEPVFAGAGAACRRSLLYGAASPAAPVLGLTSGGKAPSGRGDAAFAAQHALYWLTANLAGRGRTAIVIDDAHWVDPASLLFLNYLARRVEGLPVVVLLGFRPVEPGAPRKFLGLFEALPRAERLRPLGLSEQAVGVVMERLCLSTADAALRRACHVATGGNPFLLRELLCGLLAEGALSRRDAADRVHRLGPCSVARSVLGRLGALGPDALPLARAVAVLGDAQLRHAAGLAGLDQDAAGAAADALAEARILVLERPLRFVHPIVRQAIHDDIAPNARAAAHARAARLLDDDPAHRDRAAAHLLASEPAGDPWVVDRLRAAAGRALARGSPDAAVTLLRRARAEPPDPAARRDVLWDLGRAETHAGLVAAATDLREALELTAGPGERARVARDLAMALVLGGRFREAVDLLRRELDANPGPPRSERTQLEADIAGTVLWALDAPAADLDAVLEAVPAAAPARSAPGRALLAGLAHRLVQRGEDAERAAASAERALEAGLPEDAALLTAPYANAVHALICAEALDAAARWARAGIERARALRSAEAFAFNSSMLSVAAYRQGDIVEAEEAATDAVRASRMSDSPLGNRACLAALIDALVERGDRAAAWRCVDECAADLPDAFESAWFVESRGRLRALDRDHQGAVTDFLAAGDLYRRWGAGSSAVSSWRSHAAEALVALGRTEEAVDVAREDLRLARSFGAPRAIGIALRAVALAQGGAEAARTLGEAVEVLERSDARLELARALVDLGAALRRANQRAQARVPLERGMDLAARCRGRVLAERARTELQQLGARPRRLALTGADALTATERRVSELAVEGLSNPEIAQALFVTRKTVETHLCNAFRKLGVRRRADLGAALGMAVQRSAAGQAMR